MTSLRFDISFASPKSQLFLSHVCIHISCVSWDNHGSHDYHGTSLSMIIVLRHKLGDKLATAKVYKLKKKHNHTKNKFRQSFRCNKCWEVHHISLYWGSGMCKECGVKELKGGDDARDK